MIRGTVIATLTAALLCPLAASAGRDADARFIHRAGDKRLDELFTAELARAKKQKKEVVVIFTADWCTPCKIIKNFLDESAEVQRYVRGGVIRFIDVDEWRGPAHRLIAGVNPRKLPTLVRVDGAGRSVQQCYGSDLGLMSGTSVGKNLKRLIEGKAPEKPFYERDAKQRAALIREQIKRDNARNAHKPDIDFKVLGKRVAGQMATWHVNLTINNKGGARRWYAISMPGGSLTEAPLVESWTISRFQEHVRATITQYTGAPSFYILPVGGRGSAALERFELTGPKTASTIQIWELRSLQFGSKRAQFAKKVPYELVVKRADQLQLLRSRDEQLELKMVAQKKHALEL